MGEITTGAAGRKTLTSRDRSERQRDAAAKPAPHDQKGWRVAWLREDKCVKDSGDKAESVHRGTNGKDMSFDQWWSLYPKKIGKLDALKAWKQVAAHFPPLDQMLSVLEQQKVSEMWLEAEGRFIPYPATYLRAGRFLDELEIDMGANVGGKQWHETASGVTAKGSELGLSVHDFRDAEGREDWHAFVAAVKRKAGIEIKRAA